MIRWGTLVAIAVLVLLVAVAVGPVNLPWNVVGRGILGLGDSNTVAIVRDLRIPRALMAFVVGGGLAVTGAVLQALVRNPLADPYLLGLSGGAGLGAVLAIALRIGGAWAVPIAAFVGAVVAVVLVYRLALVAGAVLDTRVLILAGVVVSAFAGALLGAVVSLSSAAELRNAMLWLLGGFDSASWRTVEIFCAYALVPLVVIAASARSLDVLSLGEEPAGFLGVDVERLKRVMYLAASLVTAAAVSFAGIIGFVGLVVPHAIRMLWGHAHRPLLPASFVLGGTLLTGADALARTVFAPRELPVGVVTALIGVPLFAVLLRRSAT